jgi:hypothetical protein
LIQNYKTSGGALLCAAEDNTYFGKHLITLRKGKGFGEVALFSHDSIRTATAVAIANRSASTTSPPVRYRAPVCSLVFALHLH